MVICRSKHRQSKLQTWQGNLGSKSDYMEIVGVWTYIRHVAREAKRNHQDYGIGLPLNKNDLQFYGKCRMQHNIHTKNIRFCIYFFRLDLNLGNVEDLQIPQVELAEECWSSVIVCLLKIVIFILHDRNVKWSTSTTVHSLYRIIVRNLV